MSDQSNRPKPQSRQDRLAAALRENLRRRKEQGRARAAPAPEDLPRAEDGRKETGA